MNESEFLKLLDRFEKNQCSPEEKLQIEQWLDAIIKEGEEPFKSGSEQQSVKAALRESIYRQAGIERVKVRTLSPFWLKIAATILLVIMAGISILTYNRLNINNVELATENTIQKVLLSDGTIVWLKPNSRLFYPDKFKGDERTVELQGEGLFEVARDSEHPFVIHAGALTARVLGTSFNIKSSPADIQVTVLTGKVSLTTAKGDNVIVTAHEKAIFNTSKQNIAKTEAAKKEITQTLNGTEYNMLFEDTRMKQAIERLEAKFNIKVQVQNTSIYACMITVDFTDQSLTQTLQTISEILDFKYEIKEGTVIILGGGCD